MITLIGVAVVAGSIGFGMGVLLTMFGRTENDGEPVDEMTRYQEDLYAETADRDPYRDL